MAPEQTTHGNRHWWIIAAGVVALFALSLGLRQRLVDRPVPMPQATGPCHRIVSLAPSITETLFALGLGDSVVGVTRYCAYPKEVRTKQEVGGYFDPNYEAILGLQPDLVVLLPEHQKQRDYLARQGIRTLVVDHKTIGGILDSVGVLGEVGGASERAAALVAELRGRIDRIATRVAGLPRPRVLVTMGRDVAAPSIGSLYIAGRGNWYDELLALAGGENAFADAVPFPRISAEGVLQINPEVIVEMLGDMGGDSPDPKQALLAWRPLTGAKAVRDGRIHLFLEDYAVVPGPRFVQTLERLARVLHPAADWTDAAAGEGSQ